MPERWTLDEINAYKRAIKLAPKQMAAKEAKRKRKLNDLFNRLHGKQTRKGG